MATRRKSRTAPAEKSRKRQFFERAGVAALKGTGAATMGATVGAVEVAVGERAALGTKAAMAVAGLATEIFVDPSEHPILSEAGKVSLHSAGAITGYQAGKTATTKALEAKEARDHDRMLDKLKADMLDDERSKIAEKKAGELAAAKDEMVKPRAKPKALALEDEQ